MYQNNTSSILNMTITISSSLGNYSNTEIELPNLFEYFLIFFGICIFIIGIVGNLLVIIVIIKNVHMRSITNIFIGNLAIGDFCVVLMCLPATLITDITGNWWFGKTMCKIIPYIQYISVCVSVLTLTSISYERYYAIVFPLKLKATKFRAKIIILLVWTLAVLINLPHPLVITLIEENGLLYCYPTWDFQYQNIFDSFNFLILYILPMVLISYTYTRVIKVLWRVDKNISLEEATKTTTTLPPPGIMSDRNFSQPQYQSGGGNNLARTKMKAQLIARRKAAKMLISVAILFAICYLPIHLLNILRFIGKDLLENSLGDYAIKAFQIAHILVYLNSCVNPLIYNFMSDNFRKEFKKILFCTLLEKKQLPYFENAYSNDLKSLRNMNRRNLSNVPKSLTSVNNVKAVTSGDLLAKYNNNNNRKRVFKDYVKPDQFEHNTEMLIKSENQLSSQNL